MALAGRYGVADQITLHESIPYSEVMRLVSASRLSILLSLKEGSNRALSESIFCDVPVVLTDVHVGGIRKNVVPETGWFVDDRELHLRLPEMVEKAGDLAPREWGLANVSCHRSGEIINELIAEHMTSIGAPWTSGVVPHANSPELSWLDPEHESTLDPESRDLVRFIR